MQLTSWSDFKRRLMSYSALSANRRRQLIFRGHASSMWKLNTTLDRVRTFDSDEQRNKLLRELLREFRREASGFPKRRQPQAELHWEYLARHYGLPTRIMDWTESLYIAAYFAFDELCIDADHVTIWVLDRSRFQLEDTLFGLDAIGIAETDEFQLNNSRAYWQRGVMLRVNSIAASVEDALGPALTRFDIPVDQLQQALVDLDEMRINARTLFGSLEGAARTAQRRVIHDS